MPSMHSGPCDVSVKLLLSGFAVVLVLLAMYSHTFCFFCFLYKAHYAGPHSRHAACSTLRVDV